MRNYAEQLLLKAQKVLCDYEEKVQDINSCDIDNGDKILLDSMGRWHSNGHMRRQDWINCFDKIKDRLDVKGKMLPMDDDVSSFLKMKFAQTNLKNRFSICEILSFLESDIKDLYQNKIDKRDEEEEEVYDLARICVGIAASDGEYYSKVFLPSAIFFTYLERHKSGNRQELLNDCFTVGAGSRRPDLFPEVTGLCRECALEKHEHFTDMDIENLNKKIYKMQLEDGFHSNFIVNVDSDSGGSEESEKSSRCLIIRWCNPFDSSSDNESDNCLGDKIAEPSTLRLPDKSSKSISELECTTVFEHSCGECPKVFSRKDFLEFHSACFHKHESVKKSEVSFISDSGPESLITSSSELPEHSSVLQDADNNIETVRPQKVVDVRVEEPVDLMSSFHHEPGPSYEKKTSQKEIKTKRKKAEQSGAKETVKRVLRFRK